MNTDAEKKLAKIEEQNRARVKRFMEKAKEQGKKQISAIISGEAHDTLCRIRDNATQAGETVSFGQIIERALAVYVKSNVNINDNTNQPEKASEQEPVKAPVLVEPETPIQETQTEIPGPIPKRGTPEYSDWLFNKIDPMKRSGMSSIKIERQFNAEGTKPASTKKNKFNRGMADSFYKGKLEKMGLRWDKDLKKPVPIE